MHLEKNAQELRPAEGPQASLSAMQWDMVQRGPDLDRLLAGADRAVSLQMVLGSAPEEKNNKRRELEHSFYRKINLKRGK